MSSVIWTGQRMACAGKPQGRISKTNKGNCQKQLWPTTTTFKSMTFSPFEGLQACFWVLWQDHLRKAVGVETPLTQSYFTIYYWGRVLRFTARPLPAPSAPVSMVSCSYLFQVQGRDKRLALEGILFNLSSQFRSGEVKSPTEPKTCMGPRLVLRWDRLAQKECRAIWVAILEASSAKREALITSSSHRLGWIHKDRHGDNRHTHARTHTHTLATLRSA